MGSSPLGMLADAPPMIEASAIIDGDCCRYQPTEYVISVT